MLVISNQGLDSETQFQVGLVLSKPPIRRLEWILTEVDQRAKGLLPADGELTEGIMSRAELARMYDG